MSKRLQVHLPDADMNEICRRVRREGLTVGEWVRWALREAYFREPIHDKQFKLKAILNAAEYSFPTADIDQMLEEVERGYRGSRPAIPLTSR